MTEKEVLLDAICRYPDDDTPRLMYADLLERERKPARAELIRTQLTLASMAPDHAWPLELVARVNKLLSRHGNKWVIEEAGPGVRDADFQRGFIEGLRTTAQRFTSRAQRAYRMPLRIVRLTRAAGHGPEIAHRLNEWPLDSLHIQDGDFGDEDLAGLVTTGMGRSLDKLMILGSSEKYGTLVSDAGLLALAQSPLGRGLSTLVVGAPDVRENDWLLELADAPRLQQLQLVNVPVNDGGANLLASGGFEGLVRLAVWYSQIGDMGLLDLVDTARLPNLRHLSVISNAITVKGLQAVAASSGMSRLSVLELARRSPAFGPAAAGVFDDIRSAYPELQVEEDPAEFLWIPSPKVEVVVTGSW